MWRECIGACTDVKVSGANLFILKYPLNIAVCKWIVFLEDGHWTMRKVLEENCHFHKYNYCLFL